MTIIRYNGSRFAGDKHADINSLLKLLEVEPLDHDVFNSFVSLAPGGAVLISGNFKRISHAFAIETSDALLLSDFQEALEQNHKLHLYSKLGDIKAETLELMQNKTHLTNEKVKYTRK